jgi:hemin uptake protein HemP
MATPDGRPSRADDATVDTTPSRDAALLPRAVSSEALLAGASRLAIVHNSTVYYLRQTRLGRLILTK